MISCEQLKMTGHRVEWRADLVCERGSHLTDRGHSFCIRQSLLRAHEIAVGCAQFRGRVIDSLYEFAIQASDLFKQYFTLARSGRNLVHHLIETGCNLADLVVTMHGSAGGEIAVSSITHRVHDVFHGFAEEVDEDQIQQTNRRDHTADQDEVVFTMQPRDELTVIAAEHQRLDDASVLRILNGRCDHPVIAVVSMDLNRVWGGGYGGIGVPCSEQIVGA